MSRYTLDSSSLNRRVTIQTRASALDTFGQQIATWTDFLTCWASLESQSGKELMAAQAINAELTAMVTILYRASVTAAMRVLYQGRVLNIQSVIDPDTAHVALQLMCSEGLNQG